MNKTIIKKLLELIGLEIRRSHSVYNEHELKIIDKVKNYTRTSKERLSSLINAVNYIIVNNIEGDIVECGVWRGGSMMAAMYTLLEMGDISKDIYLFDTFEGMTKPGDKDIEYNGMKAIDILNKTPKVEGGDDYWCWASIEDVESNVYSTKYPKEKIHFIKGMVEDTIPEQAPDKITLLRLDTDWYESTKHELGNLYALVAPNGIVIIDDYGH